MNAIAPLSQKTLARPRGFDVNNQNLDIWLRNEATDPNSTKSFRRARGFSGTALNSTYVLKRLTAEFGPIGLGFGIEILDETILEGSPIRSENGDLLGHEKVHRARIRFWWRDPASKEVCSFHQVGQTTFVGRDKNGWFTDEEAPKKSVTDAVLKSASWLGIGADIHMGLYDDHKYVSSLKEVDQDRAVPENNVALQPARNGASERDELMIRANQAIAYYEKCSTQEAYAKAKSEALMADMDRHDRRELKERLTTAMMGAKDRIAAAKREANMGDASESGVNLPE